MPNIQGTHRITIQPPQPSVTLQCVTDRYSFTQNVAHPASLQIKAEVLNIVSPKFSWFIWKESNSSWIPLNKTTPIADVAPQKSWGGKALISCLVTGNNVPDGIRGRIWFTEVEDNNKFPDECVDNSSSVFNPILISSNGSPKTLFVGITENSAIIIPKASKCVLGSRIIITGKRNTYCPVFVDSNSFTYIDPDLTTMPYMPFQIQTEWLDVVNPSPFSSYLDESSRFLVGFRDPFFFVELERIQLSCGSPFWLWRNYTEQFNVKQALGRIRSLFSWKSTINTNINSLEGKYASLNNLLTSIDDNTIKKGKGVETNFYNTINLSGSSLSISKDHHKILARRTSSGRSALTFYFNNSLPIGFELIVYMAFSGCTVTLNFPYGYSTWGNGSSTLINGYVYEITKTWNNEWGIIKKSISS